MAELSVTYRGLVYPWQCDHMGHLNVMWYVSKFDEASWHLFAQLGITRSSLRQQQRGMAGLQQHIAYKRELFAGDIITIRSGLLEIKEKIVRLVHEMVNDETGEIAAIMVLVAVQTDAQTRKSCRFPAEVLARGRALIVEYDPGI